MNKELSRVLRDKLIVLPFVDVLAGMAQTVTTEETPDQETGTKIIKRFPVSYEVTGVDNCEGSEIVLTPDSSKKSIIYFEDFGIVSNGKIHGQSAFTSNLRLICWLNRANLVGNKYAAVGGRCMASIIDLIAGRNPENTDMFIRLTVEVARIPPQDIGLFGRYTYNEVDRQILRPPFEFFGIDLICKYQVPAKCLAGINWNLQQCT